MSLVRRNPKAKAQPQVEKTEMHFEITPRVHPADLPSAAKSRAQQDVIGKLQTGCKELFAPNKAVRSFQNGSDVYHTSQRYGTNSSCEELAATLKQYDLCLSLRSVSPTGSTVSMLSASDMEQLARNGKVDLRVGHKGRMSVTSRKQNGMNFIDSIDYFLN